MPTNFPTSLDSTTNLPITIADATTQATNHPAYHNTEDGALIAIETKLGVGSSTPTSGLVLTGGVTPGTSSWVASAVGVLNVKTYGAVGNGVADDAAPIQAALDAANSAGGGQVYFPAGTYIVGTTLTIYTAVHLIGSGIESSIIKLKNAVNVDILKGFNFASLTGGNSANGIYNWSIQNLTIDGNLANNATSGYGLRVYGYGYVLHNFRVRNCRNDGIYTEWAVGTGKPTGDSMEAHWTNVMSHSNGANGVTMAGPHDTKWTNGSVFQNIAKGIYIKHTATMGGPGLFAVNVHSWGNTQTYAWDCEGAINAVNCEAEGGINAQVRFGASSGSFNSNFSSWIGGIISASLGSGIGVEIGQSGIAPIGITVVAPIQNCTTAAVKFTVASGGGHMLRFTSYQLSGPIISGTATSNDYIEAVVSGSTATILRAPTSLTVPGNEGLNTTGITDQIRLKPGGNIALAALGKASAVNYPVATPGAAGGGVGFYAEGADGTINMEIAGKGVTSSVTLRSDFSTDVGFESRGVAAAVNHLVVNNSAAAAPPIIGVTGTDTNIGVQFSVKGTANMQFMGSGFGIQGVASAVNQLNARPSAAGNGVSLLATGASTTIGVDLTGKGATCSVNLRADSGDVMLEAKGVASAVNHVLVNNSATGTPVKVVAFSSTDTNVDLTLGGQGTGVIKINNNSTGPGGGAVATMATIGGTGPTGSAQAGWTKFRDADGSTMWVPIWK